MSRWTQAFENHPFQAKWREVLDIVEELTVDDSTVVTNLEEVGRFKKVVKYLDELIQATDPELIPPQTWQNFDVQTKNCLSQLQAYESNRVIQHIKTANDHADNLLSYVRPYQVTAAKSARAAAQAYREYSKLIRSDMKSYADNATEIIDKIEDMRTKAENLNDSAIEYFEQISIFYKQCFTDSDESKSIKSDLDKLVEDITSCHNDVMEFHRELLEGDSEEPAISLEIKEARKSAISQSEEIEKHLSETSDKLTRLLKYYEQIFGKKNEDGSVEGGLKNEIEQRILELDNFKKEQRTKYEELNNEINSLIPGATTAGLASAYSQLKKEFDSPIKTYTRLFYVAISMISFFALFTVVKSIGVFYIEFIDLVDFTEISNNFINRLPLYIPLVWLALFSSKRRSEAQRLQQEYAHKEALAKSYQSFKMQIEQLQTQDDELMKKLLNTAINAISKNASETLDKKHGDQTPINEIFNKAKSLGSNK